MNNCSNLLFFFTRCSEQFFFSFPILKENEVALMFYHVEKDHNVQLLIDFLILMQVFVQMILGDTFCDQFGFSEELNSFCECEDDIRLHQFL